MPHYIRFENIKRDSLIDYIKGIAILWVLINHTFPSYVKDMLGFCLWGEWAVPLFLLIQVFHAFKKDHCYSYNFLKVGKRVLLPFLITTVAILGAVSLLKDSINTSICKLTTNGGLGPGDYYPWIYFQFYLLLPLSYSLYKFLGGGRLFIIIILCISITTEAFCSLCNMNIQIYRLLCCRYLFLIALGAIWAKYSIKLNTKTFSLSIVSILYIIAFNYYNFKYDCLFYNSEGWKIFHWICYFYPAFLLPFAIKLLYKYSSIKLNRLIEALGICSYDIFCMQMFFFAILPYIIPNTILANLFALLLSCTFPILKLKWTNKNITR